MGAADALDAKKRHPSSRVPLVCFNGLQQMRSSVAALLLSAGLLMNDHAVDGLVSAPAGVVHRDRVTWAERAVIERRATFVHERHVAAMSVTHGLAANSEAQEVGTEPDVCAPVMTGKCRHRHDNRRDD
jgi:hypothetical protein